MFDWLRRLFKIESDKETAQRHEQRRTEVINRSIREIKELTKKNPRKRKARVTTDDGSTLPIIMSQAHSASDDGGSSFGGGDSGGSDCGGGDGGSCD